MAFKISLKLKDESKPHLYLDDLKKEMVKDKEIHPLMKKSLQLLRKTRSPYIRLATRKEMIFIPEEYLHFERMILPQSSGWSRIDWSDEERNDYDTNPKKYLKGVFNLFERFGYEFYDKTDITKKEIDILKEVTKKQIKKK